MFWGHVLKDNKPLQVQQVLEEQEYPILHLSNVSLSKTAQGGKVYLQASTGKDQAGVILAAL